MTNAAIVADEVAPCLMGAAQRPPASPPPPAAKPGAARGTEEGRPPLADALRDFGLREAPSSKHISFTPNADNLDCSGWLRSTICACRGRSMRHILPPLLVVMLEAFTIAVFSDERLVGEDLVLSIPATQSIESGYQMFAVPVSFLLVFRLNRAAVRFYDARAAFGKLIELTRVLAGQAVEYCSHDVKERDDLCRWAVVYSVATRNYLRSGGPEAREELAGILSEEEADRLQASWMQPLLCLDRVRRAAINATRSNCIDHPAVAAQALRSMEDNISAITGTMGAMERINKTPLPFAYVAHLRQFLLLYLLGMPWTLQKSWGWASPALTLLVAFALLGIEGAAVACERPFFGNANHLPLDNFVRAICQNVEQILRQAMEPELRV